ncbi:MAG: DUF1249 domain-containing protein [Colwellia sp.]|nr:DUF1249 domain-containing protein [Colwellia sp.]
MGYTARKYQPSLSSLMNLCDTNYMLMLKILANKEHVGEQRCFFISDFLSYTVTVKEVTRYTSLVSISQDANVFFKTIGENQANDGNSNLAELFRPTMVIRLYHDARNAEVISSQNIRQVKPRYDYPNADMHHPDEKQQINLFLNEWLHLCLRLGQTSIVLG